ncbi:TPA: hypothetical protein ACT9LC_000316 [Legionella pneumophila]|uniref:hypothetical protein n=1 Tax=Legionella pneumophila TaxID=446 RepID=UPI0015E8E511|nr:hypothetical protein [Legionella pneumophila]HAT1761772.1 hypothetical protein [Legionella pneumophila]HBB6938539.1 hypothetical protein [Legionella pneumophila]
MDKDYIRSSRYPGAVQAEECISIVSKPWHETLNSIQGFETALMLPQPERLEITPYLIHNSR